MKEVKMDKSFETSGYRVFGEYTQAEKDAIAIIMATVRAQTLIRENWKKRLK